MDWRRIGIVLVCAGWLAGTAKGSELTEAAERGDLDGVVRLLERGAPVDDGETARTPLLAALEHGHAAVAHELARRGGTLGTTAVARLEAAPPPVACLPALRAALATAGEDAVLPVAVALWGMGSDASEPLRTWLGPDATPAETGAALLALRRVARGDEATLAKVAACEDGCVTLGWAGDVTGPAVEALAEGIADGDARCLRAVLRLDWTGGRVARHRSAVGSLRKALRTCDLDDRLVDLAQVAIKGRLDRALRGYPGRRAERREARARRREAIDEDAVDAALGWLAAAQDEETGLWHGERFDGSGRHDVGISALALLAFLGAGHTPFDGPYADTLRAGLRALLSRQDDEGCIGPRSDFRFLYDHAYATLAVVEASHAGGYPPYERAAQRGIRFVERARDPSAGWRYDPRGGESDTSVTASMAHVLWTAHVVGFPVDQTAFRGAERWFEMATDRRTGQVGYMLRGQGVTRPPELRSRFPEDRSEAMTAAASYVRALFDREQGADDRQVRAGAARVAQRLPAWAPPGASRSPVDLYYWYWGTLLLHVTGGRDWRAWSDALADEVVPAQEDDGSWPPAGPWATTEGGRVYATAIVALALETPYRYSGG